MNEQVFQPRGLYAMIMAYKPDSPNASEIIDINTNIVMSAAKNGVSGNKFKSASGTTSEAQMPIAARLVFPALQKASPQQKRNAFKKAMNFIDDYSDRRAQSLFVWLLESKSTFPHAKS